MVNSFKQVFVSMILMVLFLLVFMIGASWSVDHNPYQNISLDQFVKMLEIEPGLSQISIHKDSIAHAQSYPSYL